MPDTRDLLVRILGDDSSLQQAFTRTERRTKQFESRTQRAGVGVSRAFARAGVSLGLVATTRQILDASISFESAFAGVRKTVDASEAEFADLERQFRSLAREIPVSVNELLAIGEAAGQLGVAKSAIIDFTRTIAALSVTTNLTADQAADQFARLANITKLPQDQFDRMGSAVVDLGNNLASTESELLDFALRIAGAGEQAGLTEDQILAIGGAFTSIGVEAEAGGTAVQKVLLGMNSAVLSGGKQLQQFAKVAGTSVGEFRRLFEEDAGQAFLAFVRGLERIRRAGGNTFEVLRELELRDQRLIRAFLGMSSNSDLLARSLDIGADAWKRNVALTEEAEKRYDTTASKMQLAKNEANDLAITLGDALKPGLEVATIAMIGLVGGTNDAIAAMKDLRGAIRGLDIDFALPTLPEGLLNLTRLGRGGGRRGTEGTGEFQGAPDALDRFKQSVEEQKRTVEKAGEDLERAGRSFNASLKGLGLKLDKAGLTDTLDDDLAVMREIEARIQRQIRSEGRTFKLVEQLTRIRGAIASTTARRAEEQAQAARESWEDMLSALDLGLQRALATVKLDDDLAALRKIERALEERIKVEGRTLDLERQLFDTRQQIIQVRQDQQQQRQFGALGLTPEGDPRGPSVSNLRQRASRLEDQIKGTVLDTEKTRSQLERIAKVLSGQFGKVGKDVRAAILEMLNDITSALKETSDATKGTGEITRGGIRSTDALIRGLGLTPEQEDALRKRNLGVSGRRGFSAFGFAIGEPAGARGRRPGLGGGDGRDESHIDLHIFLDGKELEHVVTQRQQKRGRRTAASRRGRAGSNKLGVG